MVQRAKSVLRFPFGVPFGMSINRFSLHFLTPEGGEGGGGSGGGAGGGAPAPKPGAANPPAGGGGDPAPAPKPENPELKKAQKARDKFKAATGKILGSIGVENYEWKETGDKENPVSLIVDGEEVEDVSAFIREKVTGKKAGEPDETQKALTAAQKKAADKLKAEALKFSKREASYQRLIRSNLIEAQIRAAAAAEDFFDVEGDRKGQFDDVVSAINNDKRLRVEFITDEETNEVTGVDVTPLGDDGEPLTDKGGKKISIRELVKRYGDARPHLRKTRRIGGPGAGAVNGGNRSGGAGGDHGGGGNGGAGDHLVNAVAGFFGTNANTVAQYAGNLPPAPKPRR